MGASGARGEDWFSSLYTAHFRDIVRYVLRRSADLRVADELAQEVFVVAWRRRDEVPEPGLPWLYGVARRLLANHWRSQRAAPPPIPLDESVGTNGSWTQPEPAADVLDLLAALRSLTETDQEILRLIGWEQLTVGEAATVLGCGRATAAVRLHRARRRLRSAMAAPADGDRPIGEE